MNSITSQLAPMESKATTVTWEPSAPSETQQPVLTAYMPLAHHLTQTAAAALATPTDAADATPAAATQQNQRPSSTNSCAASWRLLQRLWHAGVPAAWAAYASVVLMMSESPGSVMASTLTRKYLPQAVPRSTLSAAGSSSSSRHLRPHHIMKHSQTCVDKAVHQRSAVPCSVGCRQSKGSDTGG